MRDIVQIQLTSQWLAMIKRELDGSRIFCIDHFLTEAECDDLIRQFRTQSFEKGTIGDQVFDTFRNNDRVIHDSPELAAEMFEKAKSQLPEELDGRTLVGFNERWRYYRYLPGQFFKVHCDGSHYRFKEREKSLLTFLIYLNDVPNGGETNFYQDLFGGLSLQKPTLTVVPKRGSALVFRHEIWHEGAEVFVGEKHVLRTDIMYRAPQKSGNIKPTTD